MVSQRMIDAALGAIVFGLAALLAQEVRIGAMRVADAERRCAVAVASDDNDVLRRMVRFLAPDVRQQAEAGAQAVSDRMREKKSVAGPAKEKGR